MSKANLTIRVDADLLGRIKEQAAADDRSINYVVERALAAAFPAGASSAKAIIAAMKEGKKN